MTLTKLKPVFTLLSIFFCAASLAQVPNGTLTGKVADQTGAVIPGATVTVTSAAGKEASATTGPEGGFHIDSLAPGTYNVVANATGFAPLTQPAVVISADLPVNLNLTLQIQTQEEKVHVEGAEGQTQLDVGASSNASSLIIKGKDLEALSDDPDELQSELQALAGPSAGPNGGQIYIDGFTGGQLPPKSSIREIRVNQNPFSAQYDRMGFGRIEILTKPGTDKVHGQFFFNDNHSFLDARNPFAANEPGFNTEMINGSVGGPVSKKASYQVSVEHRNMNDFSAISAIDPAQLHNPLTSSSVIPRITES